MYTPKRCLKIIGLQRFHQMAVKATHEQSIPILPAAQQPCDPDEESHRYRVHVPRTSQFCTCYFICLECFSVSPTDRKSLKGPFPGKHAQICIFERNLMYSGAGGPASCTVGFLTKAGKENTQHPYAHILPQSPGVLQKTEHWIHQPQEINSPFLFFHIFLLILPKSPHRSPLIGPSPFQETLEHQSQSLFQYGQLLLSSLLYHSPLRQREHRVLERGKMCTSRVKHNCVTVNHHSTCMCVSVNHSFFLHTFLE